jgi:hypothetical protein
MLEARTRADRTPGEAEILDKVLFELRMNYVDECKRAAAERPGESAEPTAPGAGEAQ